MKIFIEIVDQNFLIKYRTYLHQITLLERILTENLLGMLKQNKNKISFYLKFKKKETIFLIHMRRNYSKKLKYCHELKQ
ncbi:hypothetical protein BpHYR1_028029 [Brachionus plicatilis]|uniref:Uncharacterized protein n=1 Tax=Brachionus plicatilis TaxID=10195 RepID=A0A3M7P2D8_BRAPC|nr:hypothetical protein BpHYR1_028029 [Brachionus plicatilis]